MSDEKLTLGDIAALIVQIEPTDLADWSRVQNALNVIAESSPTPARRSLAEAIKKIDRMTTATASGPSGLLADIGALIEEARHPCLLQGGTDRPIVIKHTVFTLTFGIHDVLKPAQKE